MDPNGDQPPAGNIWDKPQTLKPGGGPKARSLRKNQSEGEGFLHATEAPDATRGRELSL